MVYMNLTAWIISVMEQLGYWGIALLMFLDNVFPPIPSEIIMPSEPYRVCRRVNILRDYPDDKIKIYP